MWSPESDIKIFPSQRTTNRWETLVANFSFKNQNEENAFVAAMVVFQLTNKIKCQHADYLYTENPGWTNQMPAIYAVSCDCQMFQVNIIPSLVPDWKTAI